MRPSLRRGATLLLCVVLAALIQSAIQFCPAACVETDLTWREKRAERRIRERVLDRKRFVDVGVILRVVVRDPNGAELIPGIKLRVLREHTFGGIVDTRANPPRIVGPSRAPVVWLCSEDQEVVLLHDDPDIPGQLIWGSEGSGKTRVLAMCHYLWWLDLIGGDQRHMKWGQTAPTKKRLTHVLDAMRELYPSRWFKYSRSDRLLTFCTGHAIEFISTKKVSEAQGSQGQGYNLARCGRDELQDQVEADPDFESRGRSAPVDRRNKKVVYKQAATCTAKGAAEFRDLTALKLGSGLWIKRTLLIANSPFIDPSFLERVSRVMTTREVRRRFWCEDLPPEHMLYFNWSRERNLRPRPSLDDLASGRAKLITSLVLSRKTGNRQHALLGGHDPGISKSASIVLDAYELRGDPDPYWWVRGEVFKRNQTTEKNAQDLLELAKRLGFNLRKGGPAIHVRAHPFGQAEDKPSQNLYRIFNRVGLHTKAAQYKQDGTGTGLIKKEDRFDMLNVLFLDDAGRSRLNVDVDERGQPVAPQLVASLESMERDVEGKGETEKKNELDKSDPPAALGYALWPWEKESARWMREERRS